MNGGTNSFTGHFLLIDYFRKKDKDKTLLVHLSDRFDKFCISSIIEFEVYAGATGTQLSFWEHLLQEINVIPFDTKAAHAAVAIQNKLKEKRKTIDKADLFIAAPIGASVFHLCLSCCKCFSLANNVSKSVYTFFNVPSAQNTQKHKKSAENRLKSVHAFFFGS